MFAGQMNTALNPTPDDSDTEAILIVEGSDTVKLTKLQVSIELIIGRRHVLNNQTLFHV